MPTSIYDLSTPALLVDADSFQHNLDTMSEALPGARLRPHVKAHKCSAIAARQAAIVAPVERRERSISSGDQGNPMRRTSLRSSSPVVTRWIYCRS